MITIKSKISIAKNSRRHGKLSIAAQRMKEEGSKSIEGDGRQAHTKYTLLTPLKVEPTNIIITNQWVRHEVAVRDSPRRVILP